MSGVCRTNLVGERNGHEAPVERDRDAGCAHRKE
jgi:hypothetical protein